MSTARGRGPVFPLSVCVNLDRKRGNALFPGGGGVLAAGTPGQGRGRGARKEQEGLEGGGLCLAFNNSAGAQGPARDPGARSR